ncbi:hypothetical protein NLJ89_g5850 [Agrocybe chaxingu]|uniref:Uncharacterized protein n=1 Tax=Agrocybe chaxingu TaxID=84603 RepID=A0A9W8MWZ4_9AGAR|nr:hypothetical protein NLJ89_g5850 [Agrocybe chaxingu]
MQEGTVGGARMVARAVPHELTRWHCYLMARDRRPTLDTPPINAITYHSTNSHLIVLKEHLRTMASSLTTTGPQVPSPPVTGLKAGIAIYAQVDARRNRPRAPHWALVLHPTTFSEPDVRVYHIRGRNGVWTLGHEVCELKTLGNLVGVLSLGEVAEKESSSRAGDQEGGSDMDLKDHSLDTLDTYLKTLPPTRNGRDPSGLFIWTCEAYVIRAVVDLEEAGALRRLPCRPGEIYDWTKKRIEVLKKVQEEDVADEEGENVDSVWVVPFAER